MSLSRSARRNHDHIRANPVHLGHYSGACSNLWRGVGEVAGQMMEQEREKLWNDIRKVEQRKNSLHRQYEATGDSRLRQRADNMSIMLQDMYYQLYEMAKSDSDRAQYVRPKRGGTA